MLLSYPKNRNIERENNRNEDREEAITTPCDNFFSVLQNIVLFIWIYVNLLVSVLLDKEDFVKICFKQSRFQNDYLVNQSFNVTSLV